MTKSVVDRSKHVMRRLIQRLLLTAFLVLQAGGIACAESYFVSPSGDDRGTGWNDDPWRTIQAAVNRLKPGDELNVRGGKYREHVDLGVSGTEAQPITIRSHPGEQATLDGGSFLARDCSYLRIEGFRVVGTRGNRAGIEVTGSGGFVEVVNNILYAPRGHSIVYLSRPRETVIDYNCYFTRSGETPGKNSIIADPLFEDVAKHNFRLLPGSPCIDAGVTLPGVARDFEGTELYSGGEENADSLPDIGAFEFVRATQETGVSRRLGE